MYPDPPYPNNYLVMMTPHPILHHLLNGDESSPTGTRSNSDEGTTHNNLLAQPSVVQDDIFRQDLQLQT